MQAIEFNYESFNGVINIPEYYKDWFKKSFKVILLAQEAPHNPEPTQKRLPKGAGCYHSGRSDISRRAEELLFQKRENEK
jgi:hypothetical protein